MISSAPLSKTCAAIQMSLLGIGVPALRSDEAIRPKRSAVVRVTGSNGHTVVCEELVELLCIALEPRTVAEAEEQLADDDD